MKFIGVNLDTGENQEGLDHLKRCIRKILITPVGSRVMRRDFGSKLYELIDKNITPSLKVKIFAAVVDALRKWEPRVEVKQVFVKQASDDAHSLNISLDAIYLPEGRPVTVEGILL
jgi:phage baseplate assembly protein W